MQIVLIFLSFAILLYWILEITKVPFAAQFTPFFDTLKGLVHIYYQRKSVIDGVEIDFSFLLLTFIFLLVVMSTRFLIEYIKAIETKFDSIHNQIKINVEKSFNKKLEVERLNDEYKNNKFLIAIKFNAINLMENGFLDKNSNKNVEEKEKEILKK